MKHHLIYPLFSFLSVTPQPDPPIVEGEFLGSHLKVELDHPLAKEYFNSVSQSTAFADRLDITLEQELTKVGGHPLTEKSMAFLTKKVSVDLATLYLCRRLYAEPENKRATHLYQQYLKQGTFSEAAMTKAKEHLYVFVPGLFYERHPETGGDLAAPRQLLTELGLETVLIPTKEIGTVAENAAIIRNELKRFSNRKVILISASKGGPDLAFAIGTLMNHTETHHIKAWVSIGGVLRGSRIADKHTTGVRRWITGAMAGFMGGSIDFVDDLSRKRSLERFSKQTIPEHIRILHYVGAPLKVQVSKDVQDNFEELAEFGPNDGLTTLLDELTSNGTVITELGLDHYYRDPRIDEKSVALLQTVLALTHR